jgi:ribosome-associated protein
MIRITRDIHLDDRELRFEFVRSSGPGGQNVNKVATVAVLRFDARGSAALPEDVRARLISLAGRLATSRGEVVIRAHRYRSQDRNREDALARLVRLISRAAQIPTPRTKTKPTYASQQKRLDAKKRTGKKKFLRHAKAAAED